MTASLVINRKYRGHRIEVSMYGVRLYAVNVSGPHYSTLIAPAMALSLTKLEETLERAIDAAIERDERKAAA